MKILSYLRLIYNTKMSKNESNSESEELTDIKIKLLVKNLNSLKGDGTSMITLLIPAGEQLSKSTQMLTEEFGTATNIKSRVNRQSVLTAITTAQQKLKLYRLTPTNGLMLFCGSAITADGKEKKISICIEPPKQLTRSLYMCDDHFHTEALLEMTQKDQTFGFIIVDGNGAQFSTLSGNVKTVRHEFAVDLPKKHNKGGQSAVRFGRLRIEKRNNYMTKLCEESTRHFITNDKPNVDGLIVAGSAEFKTKLANTFDSRLKPKVLAILDIAYGGDIGFNQAIELSKDVLKDVRYMEERKLLFEYFNNINRDTNKYVFGKKDTLALLEQGVIEKLIVWEGLKDVYQDQKNDNESIDLVEWLVYNARNFGTDVYVISDNSQEGSQFVKGFGGIGGILRYPMVLEFNDETEEAGATDDFI